jgi:hypothetical protein
MANRKAPDAGAQLQNGARSVRRTERRRRGNPANDDPFLTAKLGKARIDLPQPVPHSTLNPDERVKLMNAASEHVRRVFSPETSYDYQCAFKNVGVSRQAFDLVCGWTDSDEHWAKLLQFLQRLRWSVEDRTADLALGKRVYGKAHRAGVVSEVGERAEMEACVEGLRSAIEKAMKINEVTSQVYHSGLAAAQRYLAAAVREIDAGETEYDPTLPPRVPGRKAKHVLRGEAGEPGEQTSVPELVKKVQTLLLPMNPRRSKGWARTLATRLVKEVLGRKP